MEGMRELLRGSLGKSLGGLTPLDRLAAAWPVACGRAMAEHGVVTAYAEGAVTIEVVDASWRRQLLSMREQLTGELRRIAGVELRAIHFEGGGQARTMPSPAAKPGRRPQPSKRSVNKSGSRSGSKS